MTVTRYETDALMSQAVIHNGTVYLSGQVGELGQDVAVQTKQALEQVDRLLRLSGTSKEKVLYAQVWLADIGDFETMNAVWEGWVSRGHAPARATGQSALAAPGYLVEVTVVAAL
ncbi:RidA family protein [Burkholderia sp. MR1-5-21]